jgi:putative transposase
MTTIPEDLQAFLAQHRDSREYRRGLAVKLSLQGYTYETIGSLLDVTVGFVSQAKKAYTTDGVAGLNLKYQGSQPLLSPEQRRAVSDWLKAQSVWSLERLRLHLEQTYAVVFASDQSYYELLAAANITYKKAQASNPNRNDRQVVAKKKS